MITRDDIRPVEALCQTLNADLAELNKIVHAYREKNKEEDPKNYDAVEKDTQALLGALGITKSHLKTLLIFNIKGDEFDIEIENAEKKSIVSQSLPDMLKRLPALLSGFSQKSSVDKKLFDNINKNVKALDEKLNSLKQTQKFKIEEKSSNKNRP